jgi:hypothetical protein
MVFEQMRSGGCLSYLIGCEDTRAGVLVDPELSLVDRYLALAAEKGIRLRYLVDTHTHADHFTATRVLAKKLELPVVMSRRSAAPFVDLRVEEGAAVIVGNLRLRVIETPATPTTRSASSSRTASSPATRSSSAAPAAPICPRATPKRSSTACSPSCSSSPTSCSSSRRTTTRTASPPPSAPRRPRTRGCSAVIAPASWS